MGCILGCLSSEPYDNWSLEAETRPGEQGAGWLTKRGKGAAVWSKRYFVLTETKLIYYTEPDRAVARGEIVLAGASAKVSGTRSSTKNQHHFTVTHPDCGTRELHAKSNNRRMQWIHKINDISLSLSKTAYYGKLLKQGGLSKNVWQERWCIVAGRVLDYFENPTDNQVKGSIDVFNAKIREFSTKDQKYCFEIASALPGKKGMKKYAFAALSESDYEKWLEAVKRCTVSQSTVMPVVVSDDPKSSANPMQNQDDDDDEDAPSSSASAASSTKSYETSRSTPTPPAASQPSSTKTPPPVVTKAAITPAAAKPAVEASPRISTDSTASNKKAEPVSRPSEPAIQLSDSRASDASRPSQSVSSMSSISFSGSMSRSTSIAAPSDKTGYLEKLSPKRFAGWQKRYFVLKSPGILLYYGTEAEANSGKPEKGDIQVSDILPGSMGVKVIDEKNQIDIQIDTRIFSLRADSPQNAHEWAKAIRAWIAFVNGD